MAEIYDWQDDIDKDGEFIPLDQVATADEPAKIEVPTRESGNFLSAHPILIGVLVTTALYWSGALGTNYRGSQYQKVQPAPGSFYLGDSRRGAEFLTPIEGSRGFYCGKRIVPLQKDKNFKKVIELVPEKPYVRIICEGTDSWTPIDLSESVTTPPASSSQSPYLEDLPPTPYTPEPEYYESFPSEPS